jgi:6-phosphogluconolactonase (cycloisomerase 2 family)
MAMKRSFLQVIALLLGAISLVNCSDAPSCVLESAASPARPFSRVPAATTTTGCPVTGTGGNGACSSTLTPTEVLFAQASTGAITTLAINTGGNALALMCTTATTGLGQIAVANVSATKNFLYAFSTTTKTINGFAIDHATPVTLTPVVSPFTFSGTNIFQTSAEMQADPAGRFLTVTDTGASAVHVLLIDASLGTLTEAAGSPFTAANALFTAVGSAVDVLYVTDNVDAQIFIFPINLTANPVLSTPSIFAEPTHVAANSPISMQVNLAGTFLYTANTGSISFYGISPTDGSLTQVAGSPVTPSPAFNPQQLTMDINGNFLYVRGSGTEGVLGFTITSGTGNLTIITGSAFASGSSVSDMLVNPLAGQMYLVIANSINVFTINSSSGALTPVTSTTTFNSSSNLAAAGV